MADKRHRLQISFDTSLTPEIEEALSKHFEIVTSECECDLVLTGGGGNSKQNKCYLRCWY